MHFTLRHRIIAWFRGALAAALGLGISIAVADSTSGGQPAPAAPVTPKGSLPPPLRPTAPVAAAPEPLPRVLATAEIAAVGDVMMHGMVKKSAEQAARRGPDGAGADHDGYSALFEGVKAELSAADLAFANLETPVAPRTDKGSRSFVFNAPPALLGALRGAGFDLVSFANNHVYDQGRDGFEETLSVLDSAGLPYLGAGRSCADASRARILEVNGIRIAFLGATRLFNDRMNAGPNEPCAFELDEAVVAREAAAARAAGAELVLLSVHWGVEYSTAPRQEELDLARRLLDAGVDGILGHHPHVLQPVEVIETKDGRVGFVAYSLGNFISNQSRTYVYGLQPDKMGHTRDGVILRFKAVRKDYGGGQLRTELADLSVQPLWTDNNALELGRKPGAPVVIRVVPNDRAAATVREELARTTDDSARRVLQRRLELYEQRRSIAAAILGEDFLR